MYNLAAFKRDLKNGTITHMEILSQTTLTITTGEISSRANPRIGQKRKVAQARSADFILETLTDGKLQNSYSYYPQAKNFLENGGVVTFFDESQYSVDSISYKLYFATK